MKLHLTNPHPINHSYLISLAIAILLSVVAITSLASIRPWLLEIADTAFSGIISGALTGGAMFGTLETAAINLLQASEIVATVTK